MMRTMRTTAAVLVAMVAAAPGCDSAQREDLAAKTRAGADAASREAGELAEKTRVGAGELADKTRVGARELATAAGEQTMAAGRATAEWATKLVQRGELTATAKSWLERGAALSKGGIEAMLAKGQQAVPTAVAIGGALASAVDSDTMLEPIYQPIGQAGIGTVEADAAIRGMTRVEPIDGVEVGFKELTSLEGGHRISEEAYLVMWRQGDSLVGFVFRSRRDIAITELVALAPKLVGLVRGAL